MTNPSDSDDQCRHGVPYRYACETCDAAPAQEFNEDLYKEIRRECDAKLGGANDTIESLRRQVAELRDNGTRLLQAADGWKLSAKYFQGEANGYERATARVIKERENLDALLQKQMDITMKEYKRAEKAEAENSTLQDKLKLAELWRTGYEQAKADRIEAQKLGMQAMDENAALREDAERYRWFRSKRLWDADSFPWPVGFEYPEPCLWDEGKMLDAAIDAARKK